MKSSLDKQGRLLGPIATPDDPARQRAYCEFLFGTAEQVAKVAKLSGNVSLNADSGWQNLGGNGNQYDCAYDVDGAPAFRLVLWEDRGATKTSDPTDDTEVLSGSPNFVQVFLPNDVLGLSDYAPGYQGETADKTVVEKWLAEANERLSPNSSV